MAELSFCGPAEAFRLARKSSPRSGPRRASLLVAVLLSIPAVVSAQPRAGMIEESGIRLDFSAGRGVAITVDGVPFSDASKLYVVKSNWSGRYYSWDHDLRPDAITSESLSGGGTRVRVPLEARDGSFQGTQDFELTPDRRLRIALRGEMAAGLTGRLENRLASILPGWLVGRPYAVQKEQGLPTSGTAPLVAPSDEVVKSKLAEGFTTFTADTRLGPLTITASGQPAMSLIDYRKNKWAEGKLYYWFGLLDIEVKGGRPIFYEVTFHFPEPRSSRGADLVTAGMVRPLQQALLPEIPQDRILPTPKRVDFHDPASDLQLSGERPFFAVTGWGRGKKAVLDTSARARDSELRRVGELADRFKEESAASFGFRWRGADEPVGGTKCGVAVRLLRKAQLEEERHLSRNAEWAQHPGGYLIRRNRLFVEAEDQARWGSLELIALSADGIESGLKTLRQLFRLRDGEVYLRSCEVADWPSLPFRGIHFFSGKNARELQTKMVRDILGALKINRLVYQVDYLRWEAMPPGSHNSRYVMEKKDAAAVAEEAARQGIEVIPMVNTFGHSEWLLENKHLAHLADDPKFPYAYDPSNPEVYRLCTRIYEEAVELFRPRTFHIGHDEVTLFGFPKKDANKQAGENELIIKDTLYYYHWLKERGIRTAMWGDMLLGPGEAGPDACLAPSDEAARIRRAALPKDILITDWHYEAAPLEKYTSLNLLSREGFDTVASTWFNPKNIVRFAKVAADSRETAAASDSKSQDEPRRGETLGLLQTTWAGYTFDETAFRENPDQFAAYLLAAEAAWNGGYREPEEVPYDYRAEFVRLWNRAQLPAGAAPGWTVQFAGPLFPLAPDSAGQFLGSASPEPRHPIFPLPPGEAVVDRFKLRLGEANGRPGALLLEGQLNPPGDHPTVCTVDVHSTASAVHFAVAATFPGPVGSEIARTRIEYEDGTSEAVSWRLQQTVFALEDPRSTPLAPVFWQRKPRSPDDPPFVIHGHLWTNPKPEKRISRLEFRTTRKGSALMVFGITGIQRGPMAR